MTRNASGTSCGTITGMRAKHFYRRWLKSADTCTANTTGNGIASAAVSDAVPWDGDSVTFTATLKSGATFDGWYSDAACTQLVSTSLTYTATAADLTLYAKATRDTTGTGVYVKAGGAYTEAQAVYRRVSGAWVLQDDGGKAALQNGKYRVSNT